MLIDLDILETPNTQLWTYSTLIQNQNGKHYYIQGTFSF